MGFSKDVFRKQYTPNVPGYLISTRVVGNVCWMYPVIHPVITNITGFDTRYPTNK